MTRSIHRKILMMAIALVIGVLLCILWVWRTSSLEREGFYAEGGPLDIKLAGVRRGVSDDLYGGDGEKVDWRHVYNSGGGLSDETSMSRAFFIQFPDLEYELLMENNFEWRLVGGGGGCSRLGGPPLLRFEAGTKGFELSSYRRINREHQRRVLGFFQSKYEVSMIDIIIRYYYGPRGEGIFNFEGPFTEGVDVLATKDSKTVITPLPLASDGISQMRALFEFRSDKSIERRFSVVGYDAEGRRHVGYRFASYDRSGKFGFREVTQDDIVAVVIGEEPYERVFHNVKVAYPDEEIRTYPRYIDEMAAKLDGDVGRWCGFKGKFKNTDEVLKVIDIVRGHYIREAVHTILRAKELGEFDYLLLDEESKQKLCDVAAVWFDSPDYYSALELGMICGWDDYFDKAMSVLREEVQTEWFLGGAPVYTGGYEPKERIVVALARYGSLSEENIRSLANWIRSTDDSRILEVFMSYFERHE